MFIPLKFELCKSPSPSISTSAPLIWYIGPVTLVLEDHDKVTSIVREKTREICLPRELEVHHSDNLSFSIEIGEDGIDSLRKRVTAVGEGFARCRAEEF